MGHFAHRQSELFEVSDASCMFSICGGLRCHSNLMQDGSRLVQDDYRLVQDGSRELIVSVSDSRMRCFSILRLALFLLGYVPLMVFP